MPEDTPSDNALADIPTRPTPSLSTTSDMPAVEPAKEPDKKAAEPKAKAEGETDKSDKADKSAKPEDADGGDKKSKTGIGERFSEMAARRREAEDRADRAVKLAEELGGQLKDAIATIKELGGKQAAQVIKDEERSDPRPKRDQFDNPDAFETALVAWADRSRERKDRAEAEAKRLEDESKTKADKPDDKDETPEQKAFREHAQTVIKSWTDQKAAFAKANPDFLTEHPDFDEVTSSDDVKISLAMAEAITELDNGPAIAYFLGQNKDEAERISGLAPLRQAVEIAKISNKLTADSKPKVSKAPPPAKPLGSSNTAGQKDIYSVGNDPNGMAEYATMRRAQLAEARKH